MPFIFDIFKPNKMMHGQSCDEERKYCKASSPLPARSSCFATWISRKDRLTVMASTLSSSTSKIGFLLRIEKTPFFNKHNSFYSLYFIDRFFGNRKTPLFTSAAERWTACSSQKKTPSPQRISRRQFWPTEKKPTALPYFRFKPNSAPSDIKNFFNQSQPNTKIFAIITRV